MHRTTFPPASLQLVGPSVLHRIEGRTAQGTSTSFPKEYAISEASGKIREVSVCVCVCVRTHNTVYEHSCPLMLAATCKLHIVVRHLCSLPHIYACASIQQRKWDLLLALMEFALSIDDADDIIHPACQCPTAQCSCRGNVRCFRSNISTCVNMYVHIYRYWSHEKSKGRSPKLMIALFRILWPKVLLNFFLAATKVSQSSSCSMCTEQ